MIFKQSSNTFKEHQIFGASASLKGGGVLGKEPYSTIEIFPKCL